jgi:C1A family cysteine protease
MNKMATKQTKPAQTYTWVPDVPDPRDRIYKVTRKSLPPWVVSLCIDNRVENQGQLGSCTGNAATTALEVALKVSPFQQLSRLMAYYNARELENTVGYDAGATIRSVIKGLIKTGACDESLWPYKVSKFKTKPNAAAYADAKEIVKLAKADGLEYKRVTSLIGLLSAIANGSPVVFGFVVPESFEKLPESGIQPLPKPGEAILGGHAVVADGYNMAKKYVWVRNSWGAEWGVNGYFKMPFKWFTDPRRLVDDMWLIKGK